VDTFLGLPFNIASYGLLLEIIAREVNMIPDELIGNLGDVHLYTNHIEQAKEQIGRDLSEEERYNIWFNNNYETGIKRFFDPNNLPDFDNTYYTPTPKRSISLMWNQRSVDTFLGLPFNIASYGLLLEIIAKEVNMIPDELIGNLGDVHLYKNHIEQAKEQISRASFDLPTIQITERNWYQHQLVKERLGEKTLDEKLKSYRPDCFELIGYESHPKIKAPLSN
jgi:thymidylate synthase